VRTVFPQEVESELKYAFFRDTNRGYFVEVGANRPENLSQTFDLEQRGWTGVLIEPQPHLADELRQRSSPKPAPLGRIRARASSCISPAVTHPSTKT
jgi:hypothetical protein